MNKLFPIKAALYADLFMLLGVFEGLATHGALTLLSGRPQTTSEVFPFVFFYVERSTPTDIFPILVKVTHIECWEKCTFKKPFPVQARAEAGLSGCGLRLCSRCQVTACFNSFSQQKEKPEESYSERVFARHKKILSLTDTMNAASC